MIDAMRAALEALEYHQEQTRPIHKTQETIIALRQAIEQAEKQEKLCKYCGGIGRVVCDGRCMPEQEPVAWMVLTQDNKKLMLYGEEKPPIFNTSVKLIPLYIAPSKREWVGLTDEEIQEIRIKTFDAVATNLEAYRAIEAKLKEKNNV
jgi:hypothetical protein